MEKSQREEALKLFAAVRELRARRQSSRLNEVKAGLALLKATASARAERLSHQRADPNVFFVLGLENREKVPARMLGWLLDPQGSHGLGTRFILDFAVHLLRKKPPRGREALIRILNDPALWATRVSWEAAEGVDRLDVLVDAPSACIAIEVKMAAAEHGLQTQRYARRYRRSKGTAFVYLAPDEAKPPSSRDFIALPYGELSELISRALDTYQAHSGTKSILEQFLSLLQLWRGVS